MKKQGLVFVLLLLMMNVAAQDKNIDLPQTDGIEIKYVKGMLNPIFNIYVNKEQEVYFEHIKLDKIEQLLDTVTLYRTKIRPETSVPLLSMFIYADKSSPYRTIDAIKANLSQIFAWKIAYGINYVDNVSTGITQRNQPAMKYEYRSINGRLGKVIDFTSEELRGTRHPIQNMFDYLYKLDFKKTKELLSEFTYKLVEFINEDTLRIDGKEYKHSEEEKISQELKGLDFYFSMCEDNLTYDSYLKNIVKLYDIYKKYETLNRGVEISFELKKALIENNQLGLLQKS